MQYPKKEYSWRKQKHSYIRDFLAAQFFCAQQDHGKMKLCLEPFLQRSTLKYGMQYNAEWFTFCKGKVSSAFYIILKELLLNCTLSTPNLRFPSPSYYLFSEG